VAQINIYVPDELHGEIKAARIAASQVCQQALRIALGKVGPRPEVDSVEGVTARLRQLAERLSRELEGLADDIEEGWADE
jgi:hypothetical protein